MEGLRKALSEFEWKAEKEGSFKAVIATFNTIDKDGDVTLPGAFVNGMTVVVSPWGHSSGKGDLPVGDAVITTDGARAFAEGRFYTETVHGKAAYQTVKNLSQKGIQQWSYMYQPKQIGSKKELELWPGARRVLKEIQPFEVSPVLVGAGEGVFTQSIKSDKTGDDLLEQIAEEMTKFLNEAKAEAKAGAAISRSNWTRMHAAVSELMAFLAEHNPDGPSDAGAKADAADPDLVRIYERLQSEHNRTALMDLRWV